MYLLDSTLFHWVIQTKPKELHTTRQVNDHTFKNIKLEKVDCFLLVFILYVPYYTCKKTS